MDSIGTTQTNTYTDDEKALAQKYKVEPKTVRLISEIVSEHTEGIKDLVALMQGNQKPKDSTKKMLNILSQVNAVKADEQEQPTIDEQTQERIKAYYKGLDPKAKLAICTYSELECLEGINFQHLQKEGKLINEIRSDLLDTCLEKYKPDSDSDYVVAEDIWLAGVWETTRMILQNC